MKYILFAIVAFISLPQQQVYASAAVSIEENSSRAPSTRTISLSTAHNQSQSDSVAYTQITNTVQTKKEPSFSAGVLGKKVIIFILGVCLSAAILGKNQDSHQ